MQPSDNFIILNKAKRQNENPAKVSISVCQISKALEINLGFPVYHHAIRLGKLSLIILRYLPIVNKTKARAK